MIEYTVRVDRDRTEWYLNGKLHREDGPAIEYANGYKEWWVNDKRHRTDGPAVEWGNKAWWVNGQRHRIDGPAIEFFTGNKEWWVNDKAYTEQEFIQMTQGKELSIAEIEELLGYKIKVVK